MAEWIWFSNSGTKCGHLSYTIWSADTMPLNHPPQFSWPNRWGFNFAIWLKPVSGGAWAAESCYIWYYIPYCCLLHGQDRIPICPVRLESMANLEYGEDSFEKV